MTAGEGSRGQTSSETRPRTCTLDLRPKPCNLSYGTQVSPHHTLGNRGASGERGVGHLSACISPPTHTHHGSHQHLHLTPSPHSTGHLGADIPSPGVHGSPRCGHSCPRRPRVTSVQTFLPPASTGHLGVGVFLWAPRSCRPILEPGAPAPRRPGAPSGALAASSSGVWHCVWPLLRPADVICDDNVTVYICLSGVRDWCHHGYLCID